MVIYIVYIIHFMHTYTVYSYISLHVYIGIDSISTPDLQNTWNTRTLWKTGSADRLVIGWLAVLHC